MYTTSSGNLTDYKITNLANSGHITSPKQRTTSFFNRPMFNNDLCSLSESDVCKKKFFFIEIDRLTLPGECCTAQ